MLITLAIIGIVAALTIPSVVRNYQKQQTVTKLKKAYSTLNQAFNLSQAENGMYQTWDVANKIGAGGADSVNKYFDKYWKKYFKIQKICKSANDCGYSSNTPWESAGTSAVVPEYGVTFLTMDGALYILRVFEGTSTTPSSSIYLDINGSNGPNATGKDFFGFYRDKREYCHVAMA